MAFQSQFYWLFCLLTDASLGALAAFFAVNLSFRGKISSGWIAVLIGITAALIVTVLLIGTTMVVQEPLQAETVQVVLDFPWQTLRYLLHGALSLILGWVVGGLVGSLLGLRSTGQYDLSSPWLKARMPAVDFDDGPELGSELAAPSGQRVAGSDVKF